MQFAYCTVKAGIDQSKRHLIIYPGKVIRKSIPVKYNSSFQQIVNQDIVVDIYEDTTFIGENKIKG